MTALLGPHQALVGGRSFTLLLFPTRAHPGGHASLYLWERGSPRRRDTGSALVRGRPCHPGGRLNLVGTSLPASKVNLADDLGQASPSRWASGAPVAASPNRYGTRRGCRRRRPLRGSPGSWQRADRRCRNGSGPRYRACVDAVISPFRDPAEKRSASIYPMARRGLNRTKESAEFTFFLQGGGLAVHVGLARKDG